MERQRGNQVSSPLSSPLLSSPFPLLLSLSLRFFPLSLRFFYIFALILLRGCLALLLFVFVYSPVVTRPSAFLTRASYISSAWASWVCDSSTKPSTYIMSGSSALSTLSSGDVVDVTMDGMEALLAEVLSNVFWVSCEVDRSGYPDRISEEERVLCT